MLHLYIKGPLLIQVNHLDEEQVASLPEILAVLVEKSSSVTVLTIQYHSVLVQTINTMMCLLVSYAKEIPQHPLNATIVMCG